MLALAATLGLAGCENDGGAGRRPARRRFRRHRPDRSDGAVRCPDFPRRPRQERRDRLRPDRPADCRHRHVYRDDRQCGGHWQQAGARNHRQDAAGWGRARPGRDDAAPGGGQDRPGRRYGMPSRWQSYINRAAPRASPRPSLQSAVQATTESGVAGGWTELGGGQVPLRVDGGPDDGHDADRRDI